MPSSRSLTKYRAKRDFTKTSEPRGSAKHGAKKSANDLYVIQKHAATNLHYDFRLQFGDVLKSWAVPKGPSLDPKDKRLAVEVEDHPLEYGSFEGTIPKGEYGGGTVMLWDVGTWAPKSDGEADYKKGQLKFTLEGERLRGDWMLVRTRQVPGSRQPTWLLFKERDEFAEPGFTPDSITTSVTSNRTMEEIASDKKKREWSSKKPASEQKQPPIKVHGADSRKAKKRGGAAMPTDPRPQLATASKTPMEGDDWFHEVKFDGYRMLAVVRDGDVRMLTRRGQDWTAKVPRVVTAIQRRVRVDAILDGEAVIVDFKGITDFQALQNALHSSRSGAIAYYAFDVLWVDGEDLTKLPFEERRARLVKLIGNHQTGHLRLSESLQGDGATVFRGACKLGLEGIISKRRDAPYVQARTTTWVKTKCVNRQEFVIGGFSAPQGSREEFGAVLVGYYEAGKLVYAGRVGTGFSRETLKDLGARFARQAATKCPFDPPPPRDDARDATWVKPELVAEVEFTAWTESDLLRHPAFLGLREDKKATDVAREKTLPQAAISRSTRAQPKEARPTKSAARGGAPKPSTAASAARLTHPERVVYPDRGAGYSVTKLELADYYAAVAPWILPHVVERSLALVRCPGGEGGEQFFQKQRGKGMPEDVHETILKDEGKPEHTISITSEAGLLGLVQMNVLEIHPWGSKIDKPDRPDRLVFDLDPGPGVEWRVVVESAHALRAALKEIDLESFPRTTGGKGLHVVVPIARRYTWDHAKAFCKGVADTFVKLAPKKYIATASKAQRENKVYVDYLRNARGATAIGSYSTRARSGAPVAVNLSWDEVTRNLDPKAWTVKSVPRRLAGLKRDPWGEIGKIAGALPAVT